MRENEGELRINPDIENKNPKYHPEKNNKGNYKHGMSYTPEYNTWKQLKKRCFNKNDKDYKHYGERGISVCDEWRDNFIIFYNDMGERPSKNHSIERLNNNGDYCKSNCIWVTKEMQGRNKRNNNNITIKGITRTLAEWAEISGLTRDIIYQRIHTLEWSPEEAISIPKREYGNKKEKLLCG